MRNAAHQEPHAPHTPAILDPAAQSARPRAEPTARFALPGEGEPLIFELRTAHGSVVRIVAARREPPVPVGERRTDS